LPAKDSWEHTRIYHSGVSEIWEASSFHRHKPYRSSRKAAARDIAGVASIVWPNRVTSRPATEEARRVGFPSDQRLVAVTAGWPDGAVNTLAGLADCVAREVSVTNKSHQIDREQYTSPWL